MAQDSTFTWYHKPFGVRLVSDEHPYFSFSQPSSSDDDALRRRNLADLAGL